MLYTQRCLDGSDFSDHPMDLLFGVDPIDSEVIRVAGEKLPDFHQDTRRFFEA